MTTTEKIAIGAVAFFLLSGKKASAGGGGNRPAGNTGPTKPPATGAGASYGGSDTAAIAGAFGSAVKAAGDIYSHFAGKDPAKPTGGDSTTGDGSNPTDTSVGNGYDSNPSTGDYGWGDTVGLDDPNLANLQNVD